MKKREFNEIIAKKTVENYRLQHAINELVQERGQYIERVQDLESVVNMDNKTFMLRNKKICELCNENEQLRKKLERVTRYSQEVKARLLWKFWMMKGQI